MKKTIIIAVVVAVVFGAGGFWGGMSYGKSSIAAVSAGVRQGGFQGVMGAGGTGTGGQRAGRGTGVAGSGFDRLTAGGFLAGQVVSKDATSVTVKLRDGGSRVALVSTSTQVLTSRPGTFDDVSVGEQITIQGTANSDGSVSAQSIQVRPSMPRGQ